MAIESKYKKRGSTLSLVAMLVVLIILVVLIVKWPLGAEAEVVEEAQTEQVEATAVPTEEPAEEPKRELTEEELDVERTTLIQVGDVAPEFTVTMLDGREIALASLRGKVVMVCFWATWCPPCRQELAHLQEGVLDPFAGSDLVVLPISRGEERSLVEKFITDNGYKFGVGIDPERKIYDLYASNYIPRTFIIGKDGRVVYRNAGYDEVIAKEVNEAISKALN